MGIISGNLKINIGSTPVHKKKKNLIHRKEGISSRSAKSVPDSECYCCSIEFIHFSSTPPGITFLSWKVCLQLSLEEHERRNIGVTICPYLKIFYCASFGGTLFQSLPQFPLLISFSYITHYVFIFYSLFCTLGSIDKSGYEGSSCIMFWGWFGFGFVVQD